MDGRTEGHDGTFKTIIRAQNSHTFFISTICRVYEAYCMQKKIKILSRASLGFKLLLAMKHHARRQSITGLQNSNVIVSNLSDKFPDGHPSTAVNNKNIDVMHRIIKTNRHVTYHEIRASLGMGMTEIN
ncbi:hypothetical protein EVAR_10458_1 [Eumeta japonica]|uniref:Uncharacterized protein n=1 Tax=Eumeta variegata TaxID=151549 RepID=A0A4C1TKB8_EUMVA|nr:hypothetical protein EVAR_10458_1 [Eumeta japonica]